MSTPDFSSMLRRPAGEAKKPPPLPGGDYPAVIQSFEHVKAGTGTPGIQFNLMLQDWPSDVDESDKEGIDLQKRGKQRFTCYIKDDDQLWRLDELLRDQLGLDVSGKPYDELLAESVGTHCTAVVVQGINQKTGETYSSVDKLGPAA